METLTEDDFLQTTTTEPPDPPEDAPYETPPYNVTARHASLPLIVVGDLNANTESVNFNDNKLLLCQPLRPRREGNVVLPARYQVRLDRHRQKTGIKCQSMSGLPGGGERQTSYNNNNGQYSIPPLESRSETSLNSMRGSAAALGGGRGSESSALNRYRLSPTADTAGISDRLTDRLDDLDTGLKWIRQEMIEIKQADRYLMCRLLDLRAHLHRIQGLPSHLSLSSNLANLGSCGSDLDVATWSSFLSLDEDALNDPSVDYRERVKNMVQALGAPGPVPGLSNLAKSPGSVPALTGLSRSASSRGPIRPPTRIKRKKSLPMANELEEDHFFDDDD